MNNKKTNDTVPVVEIRSLDKYYYKSKKNEVHVLKGIDFQVYPGEVISILGPSGSGKSTLLNVIGALDSFDNGEIHVNGNNIVEMNRKDRARFRNNEIGFVFQLYHLLPEYTAVENVMMPLIIQKKPKSAARKRAIELLEKVGLGDRANHLPNQLSGGECQRVALCRALVCSPSVVLADEPTGNMDTETGHVVEKMFRNLNEKYKQTFIIVTHDKSFAMKADRVFNLVDGVLTPNEK